MGYWISIQRIFILLAIFSFLFSSSLVHAESALLTPEENLWLSSRNNTVVVLSEKNNPPFSYQSASGIIQGLSADYMELIAKIVDFKIFYAPPRSRSQIISELKEGRGDVALAISSLDEREKEFIYTESYITVPVIIVVRKDTEIKKNVNMSDYSGKRVAVVDSSAAEDFIRKNYPRVIVESVSDNEVALQKTVLGEVSASVMDVTSLSFLLSKQVVNSVKIVGNLGLDYQPTFAMLSDKQILQSILEKGLAQISATDRETISAKWVALPGEIKTQQSTLARATGNPALIVLYGIFGMAVIIFFILAFKKNSTPFYHRRKGLTIDKLKDEVNELEDTSKLLAEELEHVKEIEQHIAEKIKDLKE